MINYLSLNKNYELDYVTRTGVESFNFPGGEAHVVEKGNPAYRTQIAFVQYGGDKDIIELAMWADLMRRTHRESIAVIPYLPGARMDRVIDRGALGVKVYADLINSMKIDKLVCLDPHSDVAPALYDRLTVVGPESVVPAREGVTGIIAPDKGARRRAEAVATRFGVPVFQADKVRDPSTGKLSGFDCETLPKDGRFLLVDDICDGGGTFVGLANHLKNAQGLKRENLELWVTHGIFSQGLVGLIREFSWIGATTSHEGSNRMDNPMIKSVARVPVLNTLVKAINY